MTSAEPYRHLVEMCRREADLIAAGDWDAVAALAGERELLAASLPAHPPAEARPLLEEADRLCRAGAARTAAARAETVAMLEQLRTVHAAVRAYAGGDPAMFVDTRR